jgi:hypothetical protein
MFVIFAGHGILLALTLKRVSKTISAIITSLHDEGHLGLLEQGFIRDIVRLHCTDVSEFIHCDLYGSLVKFLQDVCFDVSKS